MLPAYPSIAPTRSKGSTDIVINSLHFNILKRRMKFVNDYHTGCPAWIKPRTFEANRAFS
jgi:hypothetical protein